MGCVRDSRSGSDASTRRAGDLTDVEDDVLRERGHDTRVRPDDEDQVGCVRPDPSPQDVRFDVLTVRHA